MSKQTAVEWLEEIYLTTGIDRNVHFNQAKEMEKEQIINTFKDAQVFKVMNDEIRAEQYFNKTYE
jgi:hypothetical protein